MIWDAALRRIQAVRQAVANSRRRERILAARRNGNGGRAEAARGPVDREGIMSVPPPVATIVLHGRRGAPTAEGVAGTERMLNF